MTSADLDINTIRMNKLDTSAPISESSRFTKKREVILDAATELINEQGVKGLTFARVASAVDLNTTSVTYYFRRKELLAAAVFERTIKEMDAFVSDAASQPTPQTRVARYMELVFDHRAKLRHGKARPIAVLSDMRALEEPLRAEIQESYNGVFRKICGFFGPAVTPRERLRAIARANVLSENMYWLPVWIIDYSIGDFDRIQSRLMDLFEHGFAQVGSEWAPKRLSNDADDASCKEAGLENFLRVATRLINERGYRGASVERIASELNVTKGSFYHHLDAKDQLVLECFTRSYSRVSDTQRDVNEMGGSYWERLNSAIAKLLHIQFDPYFPLLRTTALQALPLELRGSVVERSNRMARRFAGMLIDGISEGSIRPIDPLITSQAIMAMLNSAFDIQRWASQQEADDAVSIYASTLAFGLFSQLED